MSPEEKSIACQRLHRSEEALEDARAAIAAGRWCNAVSREYYACFYAVSAALYCRGLHAKKHSGAQTAFNREFVHTGDISKDDNDVYMKLLERRLDVDYEDFPDATEAEAKEWLPKAEAFVATVGELVRRIQ